MAKGKSLNLIEHLELLRKVLIKSFVALGVGFVPMFWVAPSVMNILIEVMMSKNNITLHYFSPMEVFILQLKTAMLLDVLLCFPYIMRQLWHFVLPALHENERKFIRSIIFSSSLLFIVGVLFCLFFILPLIIRFGLGFVTENIQPVFGIGNIVSLALLLSIIFGVMFQFPLVTYALIRSDILPFEEIRRKRAYVFIGILILSGILTPPDIVSQLMLTLPTYMLFEMGLFFGKKTSQKMLNKENTLTISA